MIIHPNYVYKYKSVTEKNFSYLLDIIKEQRIYLPKYKEVNDPFEASAVRFFLATLGSGYRAQMGLMDSAIEGRLNAYRFLSLSEIFDSPMMWAHYADEYKGCCLVFNTDNSLYNIQPIVYTDNYIVLHQADSKLIQNEDLEDLVKDSLLLKKREWQYEYEWRLITRKRSKYLYIQNDLAGILIGHKMKSMYKKEILRLCKQKKIPVLETRVSNMYSEIRFVPCMEDYTGMIFREIDELVRQKKDSLLWRLYYTVNKLGDRD